MTGDDWLQSLYGLLARFPEQGAGADVAGLSRSELWGVYRFLRRIEGGG